MPHTLRCLLSASPQPPAPPAVNSWKRLIHNWSSSRVCDLRHLRLRVNSHVAWAPTSGGQERHLWPHVTNKLHTHTHSVACVFHVQNSHTRLIWHKAGCQDCTDRCLPCSMEKTVISLQRMWILHWNRKCRYISCYVWLFICMSVCACACGPTDILTHPGSVRVC